jgi:GNAT superfamily N-acetyltransferase
MNMEIRALQINDMESLANLYSVFWNEKSDINKMKVKFTQLQKNDAYVLLCAVLDNTVVGSVMGIICEELYGECQPFMVLENMVINNDYRKKGIGKALFAALEKIAREKGCTQIILVTEANRKDACGFYESVGFHPTDHMGYKKKLA